MKGNTLFEYQIPTVPGLDAIFNYQFNGAASRQRHQYAERRGYNLFDVGARYTSNIASLPVTWRLTVDNVADRRYWSTVGPSNLTGANTGNLLAHFGSPAHRARLGKREFLAARCVP